MKQFLRYGLLICALLAILVLGGSVYVVASSNGRIIRNGDYSGLSDVDCIIVLGAGVWDDGPSAMLEDRLLEGISLYKQGVAPKMLMTGDHGRTNYDEVNSMKNFAIERGVPSEAIFMDHAGFSTYESMYRARYIFQAKKVVIVTQEYHLYRAIYVANQLGLDAYGVGSDPRGYAGQKFMELREILARDKDIIYCILKPEPTFLGDPIPISGSGDATNDR